METGGRNRFFLLRTGERPRCDAELRERSPGEEVAKDTAGGRDKEHSEMLEQVGEERILL